MAEVIKMPLMSDTMEEGVIQTWHKKVGDQIEPGDIIAEVETDKATMDLESYSEGTILYLGAKEGDAVPVNGVLAIIGEKGEDYKALLEKAEAEEGQGKKEDEAASSKSEKEDAPKPKKEDAPQPEAASGGKPAEAPEQTDDEGRVKASPLAKKMAEGKGIDIAKVKGSGDNGRIVKRDIEAYKEDAAPAEGLQLPQVVGEEGYEDVKVSQMRKTIARRLGESKFSAPHFYLTMEINMDRAKVARERLNEISPVKISFNDFIIKAAAMALRQHPDVNVSWLGDKVRYNKHIHIGMAVAIDDGLVVPVIRFADNKSLAHISSEAKDLGKKAQSRQLQQEDFQGNTFTVSNLGMFDIDEFTAIINPPDACIMAIGSIKEQPWIVDGEVKPVHIMKVTMSCDHRAVDGVIGAKFLQTFKSFLEEPVRMLM